ncbi:MAG: NADH-quinone oxidoreductase subunit M [Alphaproteobacteria bacterium]|jgi:NADH-quinone oxidoreductase subunit M
MINFPILSSLVLTPLIGALILFFFGRGGSAKTTDDNARILGLSISIATFLLSLLVYYLFNANSSSFQLVEKYHWFEGLNISFSLGVDGISIFFVLLTALLIPICILASFNSIGEQVKEFIIAFLVLEALVLGVFLSLDIFVFYVFFEASLIPMYLIIGIWGGNNRVYASIKFFLYTLAGSLLFLVAIIYIYTRFQTSDIRELFELVPQLSSKEQAWLWLAFFASFAVKVPMFPFHTWLPDAHVQAPTAGSVILAGILLKLGGYGFLRFSLPMLPVASYEFAPFVGWLSVIAIIYTSFVALAQTDMKKMIAYSSVAHMGFVTLGIFSFTQTAIEGAIFQMISHGLISSALFLCVGVLYDRFHTKEISAFGGLTERMPNFALIFMIFTLGSIGLPTTSGFVGEFLVLIGVFTKSKLFAILASTGVVLGACYMLWLYKRVMFGELTKKELRKAEDLNRNEFIVFIPLVFLTVLLGIYANIILDTLHPAVENLINQVVKR